MYVSVFLSQGKLKIRGKFQVGFRIVRRSESVGVFCRHRNAETLIKEESIITEK